MNSRPNTTPSNAYFLERLNDLFHIYKLAIVSLEWEIHIDASDIVRRHLVEFPQDSGNQEIFPDQIRPLGFVTNPSQ